jgi:wyosine [tRNA(Phe)-imidazoG37] synthetase (radical SAM superfamily)
VPLTDVRLDYFLPAEITSEVKAALDAHQPGEIDWVTFVGSGEPTLHRSLGWMIRQVKRMTSIPVAVITNGSLLSEREVREELLAADAVLPTLDAGNKKLYRAINRPHPSFGFDKLIEGLIAFRAAYSGRLWLEVMLVQGLNDTESALRELAAVVQRIQPDEVRISLPIRPPAESWVKIPDEEGRMRATALLGDVAHVIHPAEGVFDLSGYANVVDAVVGIITRHPMLEQELVRALGRWSPAEVRQALKDLEARGAARMVGRYDRRFWAPVAARYGETQSKSAGSHRRGCR